MKTSATEWPTETKMTVNQDIIKREIQDLQIKRHRRKSAIGATIGTIALAGGVTGGAVLYSASQETQSSTVYCYEGQSLQSSFTTAAIAGPDNSTSQMSEGGSRMSANLAIEICQVNWLSEQGSPATLQAPAMGACLRPDGVLGVFPLKSEDGGVLTSQGLCEGMGLVPAP